MSIEKLKEYLKAKKIDAAIFLNTRDERYMFYFTGYEGIGCLIVPRNMPAFLIVPKMEYERAKKTTKIRVNLWKGGKRLFEIFAEMRKRKKINVKTLGIVFNEFNLTSYRALRKYLKHVKIRDLSQICLILRSEKTEREISIIRKACKITDEIFIKCIRNFHKFYTEKDVKIFLEIEAAHYGCELAFPPVIAPGKSSSMPHYQPTVMRLKKGFCVIDFGVEYKGYHTDITRTIYLGMPTEKERMMYDMVKDIEMNLIGNIREGKKCKQLYNEAIKLFGRFGNKFTHGLGHGIGLEIHELPNINAASKDKFKNGMIFTIEPGIYFEEQFGIRIEDDILLLNGKIIVLSKAPRELIVMGC